MLVDIGFMALTAGRLDEATDIFNGVAAARPGEEAGPLGLALVRMATGDLPAATAILKGLPPSDAALTYLGIALARQGDRNAARRALAAVAAMPPDNAFAGLAGSAMTEFGL